MRSAIANERVRFLIIIFNISIFISIRDDSTRVNNDQQFILQNSTRLCKSEQFRTKCLYPPKQTNSNIRLPENLARRRTQHKMLPGESPERSQRGAREEQVWSRQGSLSSLKNERRQRAVSIDQTAIAPLSSYFDLSKITTGAFC